MTYISSTPFLDTAFDLTTLSFITVLLVVCVLSLCFVFYLRFKSRSSHHLQSFNSLWTVRFLLVLFITLWALNELLRIPTFRRRYLHDIWPSLNRDQESTLCKVNVVLSLGLFEPAFLVTLLFLVDVSIKKQTPRSLWAIGYILSMCVPILCFQSILVFSRYDLGGYWPHYFRRSYVILSKGRFGGDESVLCSYPLLSTIVFGAFGIGYSFWFLLSCWKVVSMVINKALRVRIYGLATAVLTSVPAQIAFLGLSVVWDPNEALYGVMAMLVFLSTFVCAMVGQGILVIRPIADSLAAGADFSSRCNSEGGRRRVNA
ncbi:uncharacterized protein LOC107414951 [Ziziphus jujuba]|uniref:Uncharacterized protein LOC107414951 n=2 Tax=Ziziphus jujuba TaxID=326968 RepID=A0A6P3ZJI3_ZIZJJ|nr:uncharacterized protein LOC107414951 [Ziziphus jujuba]KAH7538300.1 hypothetical protein FEM48_Zijuj03G0185100 [Ziziphus jujuba var. spinosa]